MSTASVAPPCTGPHNCVANTELGVAHVGFSSKRHIMSNRPHEVLGEQPWRHHPILLRSPLRYSLPSSHFRSPLQPVRRVLGSPSGLTAPIRPASSSGRARRGATYPATRCRFLGGARREPCARDPTEHLAASTVARGEPRRRPRVRRDDLGDVRFGT
jgi:hypothetical protein